MSSARNVRGLVVFAAMAGSVAGAALQMQQAALWPGPVYAGLVVGAFAGGLVLRRLRRIRTVFLLMAMLLGAMASAGLTGWRATAYAEEVLPAALEGRDVLVSGVVAGMPQRGEGAVRFTLEVESARWVDSSSEDLPPRVPPRIALGWYAEGTGLWGRASENAIEASPSSAPGPLHPGDRWRLAVRLKAPHGQLNPHGYDHELRLWEQGV